ncbi:hypothetical protein COLO4_24907 [Corchorus olitorius]|uniref:Uncharacterized protein n=1 Tax=Corchorus olitorius TaxID=93759 RepID=A0A1R3I5Y1_9ROSI|nr:hypothetical protein COLO4_24907 [Corchorus olitorius]
MYPNWRKVWKKENDATTLKYEVYDIWIVNCKMHMARF